MGNQIQSHCFFDIQIGAGEVRRMTFKLFDPQCPKTARNFRELCQTKYSGTNFHRCSAGFMAQGGDYEKGDGSGGSSIWGKPFKDEGFTHKHHKRGMLAMANRGKHTNQSQFYITFQALPHLDGLHVVFGELIDGFDVLDAIEKVSTEGGDPTQNVQIIKSGIIE